MLPVWSCCPRWCGRSRSACRPASCWWPRPPPEQQVVLDAVLQHAGDIAGASLVEEGRPPMALAPLPPPRAAERSLSDCAGAATGSAAIRSAMSAAPLLQNEQTVIDFLRTCRGETNTRFKDGEPFGRSPCLRYGATTTRARVGAGESGAHCRTDGNATVMAGAVMLVVMLGGGEAIANQLPDLTGEWHGTELCDELDNGAPGVFAETSPIFIRQGNDGQFRDAVPPERRGWRDLKRRGRGDRLRRRVREPGGDRCGRSRARTDNCSSTANCSSSRDDLPGGGGAVNSCKYVYQLVTVVRPTIPRCASSPIGSD